MSKVTLYLGDLWHTPKPSKDAKPELKAIPSGALAVDERGKIVGVGPRAQIQAQFAGSKAVNFGQCLILPGFVDAHVHFPQLDMIGALGHDLLGWLSHYTYPAESKFSSREIAQGVASRFVTELLANGTTLAAVYASSHMASAEALFQECERRGVRAIIGKVSMDQQAPESLLQKTEQDIKDNMLLIEKWHQKDNRLFVALTPRFALSCSEPMLKALGKIRQDHPSVYLQTHYAETLDELAAVKKLYPKEPDYLAVYERFGLIGERTILGHGIHVTDGELTRLAAKRCAIAHCPSSNLFLGSGLFPWQRVKKAKVPTCLGTDIGAGTSMSMMKTMAEAYKVQRLQQSNISAAELLYLATLGGATALGLGEVTGSFELEKEADFQVLDLQHSRLLQARRESPAEDLLAAVITLGDDRLTRTVYVRGKSLSGPKST